MDESVKTQPEPTEPKAAPKKTAKKTTKKTTKTFVLKGEEVLAKVKELIKQGNIRRIIIKNKEGKTIIELPLTIGVVGALLAPALAAIGAVAALVAECSITVETED